MTMTNNTNVAQVWAAVARPLSCGGAALYLGEHLFGQEAFLPSTHVALINQPLTVGVPLRVAVVQQGEGWYVTAAQYGATIESGYREYLAELKAGKRPTELRIFESLGGQRPQPRTATVRRKPRAAKPSAFVAQVAAQNRSDTALADAFRSALAG